MGKGGPWARSKGNFFAYLLSKILSLHLKFNYETKAKIKSKKNNSKVSISWNLPCFFAFLANQVPFFFIVQ
jgi:uncharacterized protein YdhG (YjbR/CyaY superfamily)